MNLVSVTALPFGVLLLAFDQLPSLTGDAADPSKWSITGPTSIDVTDVFVTGNNTVVVRSTHPLLLGGSYTLLIAAGIVGGGVNPFLGSFSQNFTGTGDICTVVNVIPIDARTIQVVFDGAPDNSVYDLNNYLISGGLSILSIERVSEIVFNFITTHQLIGGSYTIQSPGVSAGEPFFPVVPPQPPKPFYYGLATDTGTYDAAFITSLPFTLNAQTYENTVEYRFPDSVKMAFYAVPAGTGTVSNVFDTTTWLSWPFSRVATAVDVSGTLYDLYRFDYAPRQSFTVHWF
jgi:hypothetical protein